VRFSTEANEGDKVGDKVSDEVWDKGSVVEGEHVGRGEVLCMVMERWSAVGMVLMVFMALFIVVCLAFWLWLFGQLSFMGESQAILRTVES